MLSISHRNVATKTEVRRVVWRLRLHNPLGLNCAGGGTGIEKRWAEGDGDNVRQKNPHFPERSKAMRGELEGWPRIGDPHTEKVRHTNWLRARKIHAPPPNRNAQSRQMQGPNKTGNHPRPKMEVPDYDVFSKIDNSWPATTSVPMLQFGRGVRQEDAPQDDATEHPQ